MTKKVLAKIKEIFPNAKEKEPLSFHCTFGVGGPADLFIETDDVSKAVSICRSTGTRFIIIGGGSNMLFSDKGFRGVVIKLSSKSITFSGSTVTAKAGVNLQFLIKECEKKGFYNLSLLGGIPGTLGGAVRGNAGWADMEISDILRSAEILNPTTGKIKKYDKKSLKFAYRSSLVKSDKLIVLEATLALSKAKKYKLLAAKFSEKRSTTQPYGMSAGSFFKNPSMTDPKKKAGYLIDQCGLKGKQIGGAKISEKHANFIINASSKNGKKATQKDILSLAKLAKKQVWKKFKIKLEEEVEIIK